MVHLLTTTVSVVHNCTTTALWCKVEPQQVASSCCGAQLHQRVALWCKLYGAIIHHSRTVVQLCTTTALWHNCTTTVLWCKIVPQDSPLHHCRLLWCHFAPHQLFGEKLHRNRLVYNCTTEQHSNIIAPRNSLMVQFCTTTGCFGV